MSCFFRTIIGNGDALVTQQNWDYLLFFGQFWIFRKNRIYASSISTIWKQGLFALGMERQRFFVKFSPSLSFLTLTLTLVQISLVFQTLTMYSLNMGHSPKRGQFLSMENILKKKPKPKTFKKYKNSVTIKCPNLMYGFWWALSKSFCNIIFYNFMINIKPGTIHYHVINSHHYSYSA